MSIQTVLLTFIILGAFYTLQHVLPIFCFQPNYTARQSCYKCQSMINSSVHVLRLLACLSQPKSRCHTCLHMASKLLELYIMSSIVYSLLAIVETRKIHFVKLYRRRTVPETLLAHVPACLIVWFSLDKSCSNCSA